ncbi:F0F1 ATP synthase subunit B family protein [Tsuneonella sp. HG222]
MPQISQLALVYQSQWFWLLLTLAIIFFVVGRGILPKVEATVDQRDAQIAADLAEAERLRIEADAAEDAWRARINEAHGEAQGVTGAAKEAAAKDAAKRLATADKKIAEEADKASAELDAARQSALTEIEAMAADATRDIVSKLTGAQVDEPTARAAVAEALARA